jgi:hypothetical protein
MSNIHGSVEAVPTVEPVIVEAEANVSPPSLEPYHEHQVNKKNRWKGILLTFLVVVLLVAGGIYGYFRFYLSPDRILAQSLYELTRTTSFSFDGIARMEYEKPKDSTAFLIPLAFSSSVSGTYVKEKDDFKIRSSVTINAGTVTVSELEFIKDSNTLYVFFKTLSDLGLIDNAQVKDKWIAIDFTKLPDHYTELLPFKIDSLTDEQKIKLFTAFRENSPLVVAEVFNEEVVEGFPSYHYRLKVQKENIVTINEQLAKNLEGIEFENIEVWIRKDDTRLTRVVVSMKRAGEEVNSPRISVFLDVVLKDYNNKYLIQAPDSSVMLEKFIFDVTQSLKSL